MYIGIYLLGRNMFGYFHNICHLIRSWSSVYRSRACSWKMVATQKKMRKGTGYLPTIVTNDTFLRTTEIH